MNIISKKCDVCENILTTTEKRLSDGRGKYCSKQCKFDARKIKVNCAICDKEILLRKSKTVRTKRFYCSKPCHIEGYKKWYSKSLTNYIHKNKGIDKMILGKRGLTVSTDGYYVYGRKKIHRYIMEQHIGRPLLSSEIVHHINEDKLDNRIENLQIVSRREHNIIHKFFNKSKT